MPIDMHAHYVPPKALAAIERDASSYGVHLEQAAAGGEIGTHTEHLESVLPAQPLGDRDR